MTTNPIEKSRGEYISRETSERLAYVGKTSSTIAFARTNTGETSGSSSVQRQKGASMATSPRKNSRGERVSGETPGRLAYVVDTSLFITSVKTNTEETSGSSSVQRQGEISMATNPRENSEGERNSRETSGRLACVVKTSPTIDSAQTNTGETSGNNLVQCQREALMAINPREQPRGKRVSRRTSGRLAYVGSPTLALHE